MRRFVNHIVLAFVSTLGLTAAACDGATTGDDGNHPADVDPSALSTQAFDDDVAATPELMAACHAAFNDAADSLEAARLDAAVCESDADCTVAVAETRCTGELDQAVSKTGEAAFLGFVDRLDARMCSDVAASCVGAGDDAPGARTVACVAHRCALAE